MSFDNLNSVVGCTDSGGIVIALDNGRTPFMCHVSTARARELARNLTAHADAQEQRLHPAPDGLTGEEAQSP